MRTGVFDLETSSLYANTGIVLCCCVKEYGHRGVTTIRADEFKSWKTGKSDNREVIAAILEALRPFDILVAHNGQYFDKTILTAACLKYGFPPELRFRKFIDPVQLSRRHVRIARHSLASLIDYFDIQDTKTPIRFENWMRASLDGDTKSMGHISEHCVKDVKALERVYDKLRCIVQKIDERGSAF